MGLSGRSAANTHTHIWIRFLLLFVLQYRIFKKLCIFSVERGFIRNTVSLSQPMVHNIVIPCYSDMVHYAVVTPDEWPMIVRKTTRIGHGDILTQSASHYGVYGI